MKNFTNFILVAAVVSVMLVAGCASQNTPATNYPNNPSNPSNPSTLVKVHNYQDFIPLLPAAQAGYVAGTPNGFTVGSMSTALRKDTLGESEIEVGITDDPSFRISFTLGDSQVDTGYIKSVTVKGYPAREVAEFSSGKYSVNVLIDNKLVFLITSPSLDVSYAYANAVNYADIAAIA